MYLTPVYNISGFVLGAGKVAVDNNLSHLTTQFLNTARSIFYGSRQEDTTVSRNACITEMMGNVQAKMN